MPQRAAQAHRRVVRYGVPDVGLRSICTWQQRRLGPSEEPGEARNQGHARQDDWCEVCQREEHALLFLAGGGRHNIPESVFRVRFQSKRLRQAVLGGRAGARLQGVQLRQAQECCQAVQVEL